MRKRIKALIWLGAIVVVLGVGVITTTNYLLDKFLDSMSEQSFKTSVGKTVETDHAAVPSTADGSNHPAQAGGDSQKEIQAAGSKTGAKASSVNTEDVKAYTANLTGEKIKDLKGDVSVSDKMDVMAILLKKLSLSDIRKLQQLARGGLTREKKREARAIIHDKVTPDQYNELITIAKKYGVSQGRNYEEVIKQEERLRSKGKAK